MPTRPAVDLFVYGTLMHEPIQRQLLGRPIKSATATLFGFNRVENPGSYPYVSRRVGGRVDGLLLRALSATDIAVLDQYEDEGRLYLREPVTVRVGAIDQAAYTYVGVVDRLRRIRRSHFDMNREALRRLCP